MKVKKIIYNPNKKGVFRVSAVEKPAVKEGLVLFSEQLPQEIKGVFYAPVMIPDLKIQRVDETTGEPFITYYDAETVEQLAYNYLKQGGNLATNIEHEDDNTEGIYPVESWIVNDPKTDKSVSLGMPEQVKGTWIMGYKCESPEVLEKIKNKLINGLSIEGQIDYVDDNESPISKFNFQFMKKPVLESLKDLANAIMSAVSDAEKTPEQIAEDEAKDKSKEKKEDVEEMADEPKPTDEPKPEDAPEPTDLEKENETLKAANEMLQKQVDDLTAKIAQYENDAVLMSEQMETVKTEFEKYKTVKMSSQKLGDEPAPKVAAKSYAEMTNAEKVKYNRSK